VNLGSAQNPNVFTFIGIMDRWFWIPVVNIAFDDGGLMEFIES
jgi:hypothetical protein